MIELFKRGWAIALAVWCILMTALVSGVYEM